jgi:hypothetical protein
MQPETQDPRPIVYVKALQTIASPGLTMAAGRTGTFDRATAAPLIACGALRELSKAEFDRDDGGLIH